MSKVAAVGKAHAHYSITGCKESHINSCICLCARMSLNVCILCSEKLLGSFDSNGLNDINVLAAAVISLSGVALSILVGKNAAHSSHYCGGNDVFTGDKLKVSLLT